MKGQAVNWIWEMMTDVPKDGTWVVLQRAPVVGGDTVLARWKASEGGWRTIDGDWRDIRPIGWRELNVFELDMIRRANPPKNATWIVATYADGSQKTVHWGEDLSGEDQPPFRGWYTWRDGCSGFFEVTERMVDWRPLTEAELLQIRSDRR